MEYSLPAWLGALAGTVIAVVIYVPAIRVVERSFRAQAGLQTLEQRAAFEEKLSVARRFIIFRNWCATRWSASSPRRTARACSASASIPG